MRLSTLAAAVVLTLVPDMAFAGTITLTLNRLDRTDATDAAGLWRMDHGTLLNGPTSVGRYSCTRRVNDGVYELVMLTCTFFLNGNPPLENITVHGAADFVFDTFTGSVSAASGSYGFLRGAAVTGTANAVTFTW